MDYILAIKAEVNYKFLLNNVINLGLRPQTWLQIETASLKKQGKVISKKKKKNCTIELRNVMSFNFHSTAASRIWTDVVIDPFDTRKWISMGIDAANHAPIEKAFNLGVIQV